MIYLSIIILFCKFPNYQVSGITFAFDPKKPPGSRVDSEFVKVSLSFAFGMAALHKCDSLFEGWGRVLGHGAKVQAGDQGLSWEGQGWVRQLLKGRGKPPAFT